MKRLAYCVPGLCLAALLGLASCGPGSTNTGTDGAGFVPDGGDGSATPTCTDNLKNGHETDVDCGRECGPCAGGKMCGTNSDCLSGKCTNSVCDAGGPPAQCINMTKDGDETDVDCGGLTCPPCEIGKMCKAVSDCKSSTCTAGVCAMMVVNSTCVNMMKDGAETDVDCGGGMCPTCGVGLTCGADSDCASGHCTMGKCQAGTDTCKNMMKDGAETDVDCGGGTCPTCDVNKACMKATDCVSQTCYMKVCITSCSDNMKNGKETDVDCGGGQCLPCADGKICFVDADCTAPDKCVSGKCGMAPVETTVSFTTGKTVATGMNPSAIAVGDLNNDKKLDLAITNQNANTTTILLGDGMGGFTFKGNVMVGSQPANVVIADLDGDGNQDLVVAEGGASNVSVYFGIGDGTFTVETMLLTGPAPAGLAVDDFNGDQKLDVAISVAGVVDVYLGAGNRTFAMMPLTTAGGSNAKAMISADWNGDSKLDLALTNLTGNNVSVLIGKGDGTFAAEVLYPVGNSPIALATGDVDKDGNLDIVTTDRDGADFAVLTGKGDGTFAMTAMKTFAAPQGRGLVLTDFDGDKFLDVAELSSISNAIYVFPGESMGPFEVKPQMYTTGATPVALAAGDFDSDGKPDLAVVDANDNNVVIWINTSH